MTAMKIGFLLESDEERKAFAQAMNLLEKMDIAYDARIMGEGAISAETRRWLEEGAGGDLAVVVIGITRDAERVLQLSAETTLPIVAAVIGERRGQVNRPLSTLLEGAVGYPVAVVGVNQAANAALLAARIGAVSNPEWRAQLAGDRAEAEQGEKASVVRPVHRRAEGMDFVTKTDPEMPDPFIIEGAADTLLNGGVVALPTDTVYGLAVDATNTEAVMRLYEIKERDPVRAIPLLISERQTLRYLSPIKDPNLSLLLEKYWPGALTVVVPKFEGTFMAVSRSESLGVRMPNNNVTLAIISMLARPVAVTSANVSDQPPATNAEEVKTVFGDKIDLIVDSGPMTGTGASTVIDMTAVPYRILREGAISTDDLRQHLGDALE